MQPRDEAQLRQLRLRVDEELDRARADLTRNGEAAAANARLGERLEEIERELERLQRSNALLFRGRRRRAVMGLLLSERLLLDDLGFDTFEDYVRARAEGEALGNDARPPDAVVAGLEPDALLTRVELASDQERLDDIERGVLDLDWLANGGRELGVGELPVPPTVPVVGPQDQAGAPLESWHNPYAETSTHRWRAGTSTGLPRLDREEPPASDLPDLPDDDGDSAA